ncbi:cytochrome c biogenesis protein ResB [Yinghuangia seranimata]|uniref:cytochrome c biogenesis protein ResB n=1 Tax=Yinghuangia seranimata TaxID=408067 RepID=UPI00248C6859|nr:cytochrome c biogenesis protein ResB [Yinghuangia seranimata]MDI2132527.1 cytochrome c biogenesis protein ResB [Yinghuangia seranimata]
MSIDTSEQGTAAAGMSTAPQPESGDPLQQPRLGLRGWLRWTWRQLTSMRVALLLLLLLSVAAIPGSLIPQRGGSNPLKVDGYFRQHPGRAEWMDKLQLFDVYSSWWFSATYLLLFISLVGCIVPRTWAHAKALRTRPPAAPRRMDRLPVYATWETDADPETVLAAARGQLKKRRFRLTPTDDQVAGEKGYARETGNLVFHTALIGVLVAVLMGSLLKGSGSTLLVEKSGGGFANVLAQYDDFNSGPWFDTTDMEKFGFKVDSITQRFERLGTQRGAARDYKAEVTYWQGANGTDKHGTIKVNEPLEIGGTKVYLTNTGYAPVVTVKDARGKVAFKGPVVFIQQDTNRTGTGVIKVPDVSPGLEQLGFSGIFTPSTAITPGRGPHSTFPSLDFPALFLTAYVGDLGVDSGIPQSIYKLKTDKMRQLTENGKPWAASMLPGETLALPDNQGSITFDGVSQWGQFQVSKEPGKGLALYSVIAAIAGLVLSLFVRRRRMWVRAVQGADGRTVVEVAGLSRTEGGGLAQEVQALADDLRASAPVASSGGTGKGADLNKRDED